MMPGQGIHQRRRKRVTAGLDHAGEGVDDNIERVVGTRQRNTPTKPIGADGDGKPNSAVRACQPGQRASLRKASLRKNKTRLPVCMRGFSKNHRTNVAAAGTPLAHR